MRVNSLKRAKMILSAHNIHYTNAIDLLNAARNTDNVVLLAAIDRVYSDIMGY